MMLQRGGAAVADIYNMEAALGLEEFGGPC